MVLTPARAKDLAYSPETHPHAHNLVEILVALTVSQYLQVSMCDTEGESRSFQVHFRSSLLSRGILQNAVMACLIVGVFQSHERTA